MQAHATDSTQQPADPTQVPGTDPSALPGAANPTAIPELGIAGGKPGSSAKLGTPEDRSTQFVAVEGGGNTTSAEALLVSAYVVMWALLLLFVLSTWRKQQRVETRVVDLERALGRADAGRPERARAPASSES